MTRGGSHAEGLAATGAMLLAILLLTSPARADYYRPSEARGLETRRFEVPGTGLHEECVIPQPFPGIPYTDDELAAQRETCRIDFYSEDEGSTGVCPKLRSSNPGLEIYEIPPGRTRRAFEEQYCPQSIRRGATQTGVFKQSITCSYTPSILGYHQVGRVLDAGRVPPSVIRTMERGVHQRFVAIAIEHVRRRYGPGTLIRVAWERDWTQAHANPEGSRSKPFPRGVRASWLFSADHRFVYGAMVVGLRARDVRDYREVSGKYDYPTRYQSFQQQAPYHRVVDAAPVSTKVRRDLASAAQRLVQMKDVSDLALIDVLMRQQDRVGNIGFRERWYRWDGEALTIRNYDTEGTEVPADAVKIREMVLRDNDCGVAKSNLARRAGWLRKLSHLSPETYRRVLWLEARANEPATANWFFRELLFTERDWQNFRENLTYAAATLRSRCRSGALRLDLDLEVHLRGESAESACEPPEGWAPGPSPLAP